MEHLEQPYRELLKKEKQGNISVAEQRRLNNLREMIFDDNAIILKGEYDD